MARPKYKTAKPISAQTAVIAANDDFFIVRPTGGGVERDIYFMREANGDIHVTWQRQHATLSSLGSAKNCALRYKQCVEAEIGRAAAKQAALMREAARHWLSENAPTTPVKSAAAEMKMARLLLKPSKKRRAQ